jgi:hypothetical protein
MPYKPIRACLYAIVIWLVGFTWGSLVFMTPALKSIRPVPYISTNPAISFPILIVWIPIAYLLARNYLRGASDKREQGLALGVVFSVINALLDLVFLVMLLRAGFGYFASLTVWLGYLLLLIVPWLTGRSLQNRSR